MGGMIGMWLGINAPERIDRLVLACTSPGGVGGSSYPLHELQDLPADERAARGMAILDSRFTPEWLAEHPADKGVVDLQLARAAEPKTEEQLRGERGQLEARSHHDVCDRLERITCPTLVASGRFDGIAPVANGEAIVERIGSNAELRVYEGGHLFFIQDAAALPAITEFLAG
jgi:pimeloyl-ACP methyl ester carboxylesterase